MSEAVRLQRYLAAAGVAARRKAEELITAGRVTVNGEVVTVLGTKVDVPTIDGTRLTVKVPPGVSSGSRLRLKGKGIAGGDQYIELRVVAPARYRDVREPPID